MSTNKQQSTMQPDGKNAASTSTIPTVLYDSVNRVITVEVVVSRPPRAGTIMTSASSVTVPSGTWAVHWELHMLTTGLEAHFDSPGIVMPSIPPKTAVLTGPSGTGTLWTVQIKNDAGIGLSFPYEIAIKSGAHTTRKQVQASKDDPVPVQDPLDPPKPR
ncbi:MAG TPA: hypothetical protein VLX28_10600 [Thermoanaerobaculia bacterium]|nr:hypothetical protein [Thermoanaerobaculia bacterium]